MGSLVCAQGVAGGRCAMGPSRKRLVTANLMSIHNTAYNRAPVLRFLCSPVLTASPPAKNQLYIQTGNQSDWWMPVPRETNKCQCPTQAIGRPEA